MNDVSRKNENVDILVGMGFTGTEATLALNRTNNNVETAAYLLQQGEIDGNNDNEFDLIAASNPEPVIRPPTVFVPKQNGSVSNTGMSEADEAAAVLDDSRISSLVEMGFSAVEATEALSSFNGDVNEALSFLLSTR